MTKVGNESGKWLPSGMKRMRMEGRERTRGTLQTSEKNHSAAAESPPAHTEIGGNIFSYFKKKLKILRE